MNTLNLPEKVFVIQQKRTSNIKKTELKEEGTEVYILAFETENQALKKLDKKWEIASINSTDLLESIPEEKHTAYGLRKYGVIFFNKEGKKTAALKDKLTTL